MTSQKCPFGSWSAVVSLICGICGCFGIGSIFGLFSTRLEIAASYFLSLTAIFAGHRAIAGLVKSNTPLRLKIIARCGLTLGYITFLILSYVWFVDDYSRKKFERGNQRVCLAEMEMYRLGLIEYESEYGKFPRGVTPEESEGIIDQGLGKDLFGDGWNGPWLYYANAKPQEKTHPLLVSPKIGKIVKKRAILFADFSLEMLDVEEANAIIATSPTKALEIWPTNKY